MSETMEIVDEREKKKKQTNKQTKIEKNKGKRSYSERMRPKWFCCAFKLSFFFQLIYKAFLIFTSNLELALSIISRQREL